MLIAMPTQIVYVRLDELHRVVDAGGVDRAAG
jgi:hypothetical protein